MTQSPTETKRTRAVPNDEQFANLEGQIAAISRSNAVIEFELDGTIIDANTNFLATMGYSIEEVRGQHHRIFAPLEYSSSKEYEQFWKGLRAGEFKAGEFKRLGKGGKEIWIQASYNPIMGSDGEPFKVVKYASDVTAQKPQAADSAGQLEAIGKSQAVIEFELDGTIITANQNFLLTLGYTLSEIQGKHHSLFVEEESKNSSAYKEFWAKLGEGEYIADEFKRLGKGGKEIWIQASYNPIRDLNGNPYKVVKYASDVTAQKLQAADSAGQLEAIGKSQAVIEFELDGTIITANQNFLSTLGYTLGEIQGKHHSLFVEEEYKNSSAYKEFWAKLRKGEYIADEFKRLGKGGKEIWIQASYNPIRDLNGNPYKVVKYASDVTQSVQLQQEVVANREREQVQAEELRAKVDTMLDAVHAAAAGDLTKTVDVCGEDAIGRMGEELEKFLKRLRGSIQEIAENAETLAAASEEFSAVSLQMRENSERTAVEANSVSETATQVSGNVQSVASATEEMTASIREIAQNTAAASNVGTSAVHKAASTNATIGKLGDSSKEIGHVVKVITSIAAQTNLLALNATIEAARAGEAGKGFAVVANEVKELAKETAKATEDISQKIEAIQIDTREAIAAIGEIGDVVGEMNNIQDTIATAVEEQTATTNEMSRNVNEGAEGTGAIAKSITSVAEAARETAHGASQTQGAAGDLADMASRLQVLVSQFKY